ncbi:hypothetical protein E2320_011962 [Naja naja]|nr:hypothetical protein E2320_011962 [Naja naja]
MFRRGLSSPQATCSLFRLVVFSQLLRCTQLLLAKEKPPPTESHSPSRIFGAILSIMLTCGIICIMVAATVSFTQVSPKVMQLNFQNRPGSLMNQSVVVSKAKKTITYYITSSGNQTTAILFDCKNLSGHSSCYLKRMNAWDQDAAQASFNLSKHKEDPPLLPSHGSQYYREFLGVVPGSLVPPAEAGEAVRGLCKQMPIRWVKKKDDPPKQRLIYLEGPKRPDFSSACPRTESEPEATHVPSPHARPESSSLPREPPTFASRTLDQPEEKNQLHSMVILCSPLYTYIYTYIYEVCHFQLVTVAWGREGWSEGCPSCKGFSGNLSPFANLQSPSLFLGSVPAPKGSLGAGWEERGRKGGFRKETQLTPDPGGSSYRQPRQGYPSLPGQKAASLLLCQHHAGFKGVLQMGSRREASHTCQLSQRAESAASVELVRTPLPWQKEAVADGAQQESSPLPRRQRPAGEEVPSQLAPQPKTLSLKARQTTAFWCPLYSLLISPDGLLESSFLGQVSLWAPPLSPVTMYWESPEKAQSHIQPRDVSPGLLLLMLSSVISEKLEVLHILHVWSAEQVAKRLEEGEKANELKAGAPEIWPITPKRNRTYLSPCVPGPLYLPACSPLEAGLGRAGKRDSLLPTQL